MSVETIVRAEFEAVAREQEKTLTGLGDDTVLLESGLDSLCFAIIVARLEDRLGVDPFTASEDVYFPRHPGGLHQILFRCCRGLKRCGRPVRARACPGGTRRYACLIWGGHWTPISPARGCCCGPPSSFSPPWR